MMEFMISFLESVNKKQNPHGRHSVLFEGLRTDLLLLIKSEQEADGIASGASEVRRGGERRRFSLTIVIKDCSSRARIQYHSRIIIIIIIIIAIEVNARAQKKRWTTNLECQECIDAANQLVIVHLNAPLSPFGNLN